MNAKLLFTLGAVLAVAVGVSFAWALRPPRPVPVVPLSEPAVAVNLPGLTCDAPIKDYGEIGQNLVEPKFILKNTGSVARTLTKLGKSCGCMEVELDRKTLPPGETLAISVKMHINPKIQGKPTNFYEQVLLHFDGQEQPLPLVLRGTFIPPVYWFADAVRLAPSKSPGEPAQGEVEVFLRRAKGIELTSAEVLGGGPQWKAAVRSTQPIGDGSYAKTVVVVTGPAKAPTGTASLLLRTNAPEQPHLQFPIYVNRPEATAIRCAPERLAFGVIEPGGQPVERIVALFCAESPVTLAHCEPGHPSLKIEPLPASPGATFRLRCVFDPRAATGGLQAQVKLLLRYADREQSLTLPVTAYVKPS